ncbi:hypothetical protein RCL1_002454 [Eukaryota sp. TZLM3-RCL]
MYSSSPKDPKQIGWFGQDVSCWSKTFGAFFAVIAVFFYFVSSFYPYEENPIIKTFPHNDYFFSSTISAQHLELTLQNDETSTVQFYSCTDAPNYSMEDVHIVSEYTLEPFFKITDNDRKSFSILLDPAFNTTATFSHTSAPKNLLFFVGLESALAEFEEGSVPTSGVIGCVYPNCPTLFDLTPPKKYFYHFGYSNRGTSSLSFTSDVTLHQPVYDFSQCTVICDFSNKKSCEFTYANDLYLHAGTEKPFEFEAKVNGGVDLTGFYVTHTIYFGAIGMVGVVLGLEYFRNYRAFKLRKTQQLIC